MGLLLLKLFCLYQKLNIDTNWWWLGAGLMGVVMVGCWFNGIDGVLIYVQVKKSDLHLFHCKYIGQLVV